MEEFAPLIMLLFFWVIIGLPVAAAKKAAGQKKAARPAVRKTREEEQKPAPAHKPAEPERLTTLTPSISLTGHDDSIYQGSLNAFTGEGYDPCHEEQMLPLMLAEETDSVPHVQQARAGLPLGWTDNDIVRGIVMSEILNRKH